MLAEVHRSRPTVTGPAPRLVKRLIDAGRRPPPEGVVVVPVASNVHRAPEAWGPDATTFHPDRSPAAADVSVPVVPA